MSTLLVLASSALPSVALAQLSQSDQAAIAQTRTMAVQAINTRDFSKIEPYLHPTFTITTVDNRVFHKVQEFEQYWNQQLTGPIKNIAMEVKVDPSRTVLSPTTAVSYGEAISTFSFSDGSTRTMPMRWTAVLQKLQDRWTIQSLHFSSNLLDNPVLRTTQEVSQKVAIGAGVGGLLLGAIAALVLRRPPKSPNERA